MPPRKGIESGAVFARLMEAILRGPFAGIAKPEALRHLAPDAWSGRLTQEHRVVYLVSADRIVTELLSRCNGYRN